MWFLAHWLRHIHDFANKAYIYGQDPEHMHDKIVRELSPRLENNKVITWLLKFALESNDPILKTEFLGTTYKNPVGIAAGMLKQPDGLKFWESLGVGYIEVGSILGEPRDGNPKPRIWRYPHDITWGLTVVNQMGLPQQWAARTAAQFQQREDDSMQSNLPIWANLTSTPNLIAHDEKVKDIVKSMRHMWPYVKKFVINVSCPNTGENLQQEVRSLLEPIMQAADVLAQEYGEKKPILAKIWPVTSEDDERVSTYPKIQDNTPDQIKFMLDTFVELGLDGVIATNTAREHIGVPWKSPLDKDSNPRWWMSGKMLHEQSLETVCLIKEHIGDQLKIVWLGWIWSGNWPKEWRKSWENMLIAWADMVQIYTGIVNNITSPHFVNDWIANYRWSEVHKRLDKEEL